ncbi:MAG: hypothetical protein K8S21_08650 [Gemmatimonadetes bacterium]|nr:hypothetical protein [Gemmatimonadota bacterium]
MIPLLKWVAGTLLAAVVAFTLLVPKRVSDSYLTDDARLRRDAWNEYQAARDRAIALHELRARAEVRALAVALPAVSPQEPLVRIDPRVPPGDAARVRDRFATEWREATGNAPRYPVALVVRVDTAVAERWFRRAVALPESPGAPCAIVVSVSRVQLRFLGLAGSQRFLGACGFFAAFGAPGTEVASWLRATRLASARYLAVPWSIDDDSSRLDLRSGYAFYYGGSIELAACRSGRISACADLLSPDPRALPPLESARPALWDELASYEPGTEVYSAGSQWSEASRIEVQSGLLAALAKDVGWERFGQMWRGPKSLAESYQAEAGRPLTAWVEDQVAQRTLPYRAGPGLPAVPTALGMALLLLGLGLGLRFAPRRVS